MHSNQNELKEKRRRKFGQYLENKLKKTDSTSGSMNGNDKIQKRTTSIYIDLLTDKCPMIERLSIPLQVYFSPGSGKKIRIFVVLIKISRIL